MRISVHRLHRFSQITLQDESSSLLPLIGENSGNRMTPPLPAHSHGPPQTFQTDRANFFIMWNTAHEHVLES